MAKSKSDVAQTAGATSDNERLTSDDIAEAQANAQRGDGASDGKAKKTKRERFLHMAAKRTEKASKALRALARCFDKRGYEYSEVEAAKVNAYIDNALDEIHRMQHGGKVKSEGFSL